MKLKIKMMKLLMRPGRAEGLDRVEDAAGMAVVEAAGDPAGAGWDNIP